MPIDDPKRSSNDSKRSRRRSQRGFTLIELIMVVVILGVLAVFAAPRMFNNNDFNARGFHDETLSLLRFAQKAAIAQRHTVCVTFPSNNSATVMVDTDRDSTTGTRGCEANLIGPKGDSPGAIVAKPGVTYSPTPNSFNFDGLGQPVNAAGALVDTQVIQFVNAAKVFVEAGTGYVHD